jgi:dGTPase
VYLGEPALREQKRVANVIHTLFAHYLEHPETIPELVAGDRPGDDLATRVTDYVAGMTDRFCIRQFEELVVPREFRY